VTSSRALQSRRGTQDLLRLNIDLASRDAKPGVGNLTASPIDTGSPPLAGLRDIDPAAPAQRRDHPSVSAPLFIRPTTAIVNMV